MLRPIFDPARGKLRILGYCSGSGNTLWTLHDLQLQMEKLPEGCPFEVAGVFADNPASGAAAEAVRRGIPCESIDIRQYYADRGMPLKDRAVRAQFDAEAMALTEKFRADMILLSGYVWATTDVVLDRYTVINVHPGDLALTGEEGRRVLAGPKGVQTALSLGLDHLRASSHLATKELDAGPLLIRSPKVPVDDTPFPDEESRFRHYLKLVNEQSRLTGARTVLELALGNFATDADGSLYYKNEPAPQGICIEDWSENKPRFMRQTDKILRPRSVAVIGASVRPGLGNAVVRNLCTMGFNGSVYAVNRKGESVHGVPAYTSILEIPEPIDLAVCCVPSAAALAVAEECGKKGVAVLLCITAGFREIGGEGVDREKKLVALADKYNMCVIGPNCMGLANTAEDVRLSSMMITQTPPPGPVAFLTQSGAIGTSLIDFAGELDVGFSVIVSLGNMANTNPCDLLPLLEKDDNTRIICMYMETVPEPYRFERVMAGMSKPVIMVKAGRSSAGAAAASSHTGSLAGSDELVDALLKKCGVIRADSLEDAFLLASSLSKMPWIRGRRVGIISNAGGLGTLTTDALVHYGFELPQLEQADRDALAAVLLPEASTRNPLDLVAAAPPDHYEAAARTMIASGKYDAIIVDCVPPATVDTGKVAEAMVDILKTTSIPIFSCFFGPTLGAAGRSAMKAGGIPSFNFPDQMVRTMHYMVKLPPAESRSYRIDVPAGDRMAAAKIISATPAGSYLDADSCFRLLSLYGIPMAKSTFLAAGEAVRLPEISFPVVAKIDHPDIVHKSDVGGVRLDIGSETELTALMDEWTERFPGLRGLQIQEQVSGKLEMIIGASLDPALGHSVLVGMGGTMVEVFKDVAFGHVPLSTADPDRMLDSLRCRRLLDGYRGSEPADKDQLREILMRVSRLLLDFPQICEMDINPLIYDPSRRSFIAVDARVRIM